MPPQIQRSDSHPFIVPGVVFVILVSLAASTMSVRENLRFFDAKSQILSFVQTVRTFANEQPAFAPVQGQDLWASMVASNRILQSTPQRNPWNGQMRASAGPNSTIVIESALPSQDCRRIGLFFLESAAEFGFIAMEAQSDRDDASWMTLYPSPAGGQDSLVNAACGETAFSRLALVFKLRG
jgi:hypothetical protein